MPEQPQLDLSLPSLPKVFNNTSPHPHSFHSSCTGFLDVSQIDQAGILPQDICTCFSLCLKSFSPGYPQDSFPSGLDSNVTLSLWSSLTILHALKIHFLNLSRGSPCSLTGFIISAWQNTDLLINSIYPDEPIRSWSAEVCLFFHSCIPDAWNSTGI